MQVFPTAPSPTTTTLIEVSIFSCLVCVFVVCLNGFFLVRIFSSDN